MSQQNASKPIKTFRTGGIKASVLRNELSSDGHTIVKHSVRIEETYRKDDGSYENTNYYFPSDLRRLILVAQKAFEFVSLRESKDVGDSIPF